ncbi:MAG: helix-turn-helix transcriptional regulator [Microthrixaceae bacterium]|nr:helix-turn-helix transcriptional regulator [Microthrixaceae bacterium]
MAEYKTTQVAELLGVSADTVRRWCEEGRLASSAAGGRHRIIDGADLADFLRRQASAFEPESLMPQSARNRFTGIVTRVDRDALVAVVEIHSPPHRIVSMMTREAADELDLQPGVLATAAVKSTNVVVELPAT